jgi:hypothetical protein
LGINWSAAMRTVLAAVLSLFAVACSWNPGVRLTPQQRSAPVIGIPLAVELFYVLAVAPRDRASDYDGTFRRVVESIQIMDGDRRGRE